MASEAAGWRTAHGAMGTEGSNWRVVNPHGGPTRRAGALDRLVSSLGGGLRAWAICGKRHLEQAEGYMALLHTNAIGI